jgi:hypothetical protein
VNPAQLQAYLQQHKQVVLGVGAAGVVGVALLRRKKAGGDVAAAPATTRPAGTIPAAAVVPAQGYAAPDSSAYDVYNALTGQLEQMRQTIGGATTTAPEPVSSPLLTNTDWLKQAVTGWVQQKGGNAIDEQSVLNAYLQAAPLHTSDLNGVNWAISTYGAPPEGTPGVSSVSR